MIDDGKTKAICWMEGRQEGTQCCCEAHVAKDTLWQKEAQALRVNVAELVAYSAGDDVIFARIGIV